MEENVALDSSKQKNFVKSLKGIKKLMKKSGAVSEKPTKQSKPTAGGKVTKKKRRPRGLVYLSHIPHGFYEHQMTEYFKQFGLVTNARVIRSKRTGRSKGHAFVEFKDIAVAQVVAETMNNYLMGKRLIKAVYIPPKDQRHNAMRKNWNDQHNPGSIARLNMKKTHNATKSEVEDLKTAKKLLSNLTKTKKKLKELGIDYDFFTAVDVPEVLAEEVVVKDEKTGVTDNNEDSEQKPKKKNKKKAVKKLKEDDKVNNKEELSELQPAKKQVQKTEKKKQKKLNKDEVPADSKDIKKEKKSVSNQIEEIIIENKKSKKNKGKGISKVEVNNSQQEQKKIGMKQAGVKPPEDFITIQGDDESDDSDYQFDSDEFENIMNNDDSDSNISNEDDNDADISQELSDNSDSKEIPVKKNNKTKKMGQSTIQTTQSKKKVEQKQKRKISEKIEVQSKKPKFEKQIKKKLPKKQLKIRK